MFRKFSLCLILVLTLVFSNFTVLAATTDTQNAHKSAYTLINDYYSNALASYQYRFGKAQSTKVVNEIERLKSVAKNVKVTNTKTAISWTNTKARPSSLEWLATLPTTQLSYAGTLTDAEFCRLVEVNQSVEKVYSLLATKCYNSSIILTPCFPTMVANGKISDSLMNIKSYTTGCEKMTSVDGSASSLTISSISSDIPESGYNRKFSYGLITSCAASYSLDGNKLYDLYASYFSGNFNKAGFDESRINYVSTTNMQSSPFDYINVTEYEKNYCKLTQNGLVADFSNQALFSANGLDSLKVNRANADVFLAKNPDFLAKNHVSYDDFYLAFTRNVGYLSTGSNYTTGVLCGKDDAGTVKLYNFLHTFNADGLTEDVTLIAK